MGISIVNRKGFVVAKKDLTAEESTSIKKDLKVRADWDPIRSYGPPPAPFKVYTESDNYFGLPRFWAAQHLQKHIPVTQYVTEPAPRLIFNGQLNCALRQDDAVAATHAALEAHGGGILSLHTGGGKTCVALHVACTIKLKTLIVVNKTVLLQQWKERVETFVPTATVGCIQGPVCEVNGKDIVIAMLQSLSQREYNLTGFGMAIVDECNHVAAPTFSQAMLQINCPNMLGLSATPHRKDGLTRVLLWFLGPIYLSIERKDQAQVCVDVHSFSCQDYSSPPPTRCGKLNYDAMIQTICSNEARNKVIVDLISLLPDNRHVLVLSARRPHCSALCAMLHEKGISSAVYLGGMKKDALQEAVKARVIAATFSMAAEGLDIPSLNTLVLATPKRDIVQACGRVLRGEGGVVSPKIIDIKDTWPCLQSQYYGRSRFYKSAGYTVI